VRGLSLNTLAKRLFSDVVRDPDLLIPSIKGFPRPSLNRSSLVAPGAYPRSSLLLIKSPPNPLIQSLIDRSVREASSVDPIAILQLNPVQPLNSILRRLARERKLADLGPGMVKYPEKGRMVLDPSSIIIEEVITGDRITYSAAERFRTGIVKIPNTYIEAMKSDFSDY
jgi:hypothetical protein